MTQIRVIVVKVDYVYIEQHFDELVERLYPERKSRVLAFRRREPAYVSIAAGLLLQGLAEKMLGIAPRDLVLDKNENGKPSIQGHPEFYFNLSHAGEYVVLAYGDVPLGVDIEEIRDKNNRRVAKRCFTEAEYAYVAGADSEENREAKTGTDLTLADPSMDVNARFFYLWTMKESYLKLTGEGISVPLNSFEIDPVQKAVKGTHYRYSMRRMDDYWLAVCTGEKCEIAYAHKTCRELAEAFGD